MPGMMKRKFNSETGKFMAAFTAQLRKLAPALPFDYDEKIILDYYKNFYPNQWANLVSRYEYYLGKDQHLVSVGKKRRYNHKSPESFFYSLLKIKHMCSRGYKAEHKKSYCEEKRKEVIECLKVKIKKKKEFPLNIQFTDPEYFKVYVSAYHRVGATQKNKIEIINELKKYKTTETVRFFRKLNDSERNNQIRNISFAYLQSVNEYVRKRKSFKGKKKSYYTSHDDFIVTPADLAEKLESGDIQSKKSFDLFLSHSYRDNDLVRDLLPILNRNGFNVYCDWTSDNDFLRRELISEYTKKVIEFRIKQSDRVLFMQTYNSVDECGKVLSPWVKMELEHALIIGKEIVCINLTSLPSLFADIGLKDRLNLLAGN